MADGVSIDASEVNQLAGALHGAGVNAGRYIRSAATFTALNVKKDWQATAKGQLGAKGFPPSIGYDINTFQGFGQSVLQVEIGPDKERAQGALGNLIEYGGDTRGGLDSRRGFGAAALHRNAADFEKGLSMALEDAERAAGVDGSVVGSAGAVLRGSYR